MCGICGIFHFNEDGPPVDQDILNEMNHTLFHRGPDDGGSYLNQQVGLAMRRLSIIDLSSGRQPIHNEDKSIWIVFNGEIYNYQDLRKDLIRKGHNFYTNSDTETIIHLYEEYGDACIRYLRGMFGFALWDNNRQSLLIVRDRLGIKPLYYSVLNDSKIVFGSELKALLRHPEVDRKLDVQSLDLFLTYGYIPSPFSIYKNINKLLPGHYIKIDSRGVVTRKYWDLYFQPDYGKSEKYFQTRFEEIFSEAVNMRLISEVPLGAFLSGGVDSSLIVAEMARTLNNAPNTFTVGFSGNTGGFLDERPLARLLADTYGCRHREVSVAPDVNNILDGIVNAFDEPFADDSVIPSYYICEFAKTKLTVALTGLGGDELFAGYERYLGFQLSLLYDLMPQRITQSIMLPLVNSIPEQRSGHYIVNHIKRFLRAAGKIPADRYTSYISVIDSDKRKALFSANIRNKIDFGVTADVMTAYYNASENAEEPLNRMLYQDIKTYLPDDILALTDRIGMKHSLELRVPFTDHVLMEFCATIPFDVKIKQLKKKYLLRKIAERHVPKEILTHRKQGFASPMATWLKTDLKPLCNSLLSKEKIESLGVVNPQVVGKILNEHLSRKELHDRLIFSLIMLHKWLENYEYSID